MKIIILFIAIITIGLYSTTYAYAVDNNCKTTVWTILELTPILGCIEDRLDALENAPVVSGSENTSAINIGVGSGVFSSEVGDQLQFKSITGVGNTIVTNNSTTIIVNSTGGSGESTQCINLGTSTSSVSHIIKNSTNGNCFVRNLTENGGGIDLIQLGDSVLIGNILPESTSGSNVGTFGNNVFDTEVSNDLQFKKLLSINGCILVTNNSSNVLFDILEQCKEKQIAQMAGEVYLSLTKTNIGNAYIDIYVTAFDEENIMIIDCANVTYGKVVYIWDYVGTGTQQLRWVNVANNTQVFYESPTFTSDRDAIDSGFFVKPIWCIGTVTIEQQGKSTVAGDDPIAKGYKIVIK